MLDFIKYSSFKAVKTAFFSSLLVVSNINQAQEASLLDDNDEIENIEIRGTNKTERLEKSGFKIELLQTEEFKNSNYNLVEILKNSPGISVRQNGGLGSDFDLSLNGLSGNQIRYFFDGIPMEDFGSALTFPANLVEQIQIYKGVVPVSLGSDALGGAVNVVTPSLTEDALDLSYTFGSFNTHKLAIFSNKYFDNDVFLRLSTSFDHSDNNYRMNEVVEIDDLGNVLGTMSVERFHDQYTSGMLKLKAGVVNKRFADELSISATYAKNRNNEQHPAKSINQVFGKYHSNNDTQLLSTTYKKAFKKFDLNAYFLTGIVKDVINDSYSRDYNWSGEYNDKSDELQGELSTKSIFTIEDSVTRASLSGRYKLSAAENISFQYSHNHLSRDGYDSLNLNNTAFSLPNWIRKSVVGLAYDNSELLADFDINIFAKSYFYDGQINSDEIFDSTNVNVKTDVDFNESGYGSALSYKISPKLHVKFSYEKAFRLPDALEILGTGKYVLPSVSLKPEESDNINLGVLAEFNSENTYSRIEGSLFYRGSTNFIRYVPVQIIYGRYKNVQQVETTGLEASYYLSFYDQYSLQFNLTYQDLINKSEYDSDGALDVNFNSRMPNEPYFFANMRLSADFDFFGKSINTFWTTSFVEKFFLNWESTGSQEYKLFIPSQLTHDIDFEYALGEGDYNVSLSARNIFNANVYDNFNIEKPGRAFYLKFRYIF